MRLALVWLLLSTDTTGGTDLYEAPSLRDWPEDLPGPVTLPGGGVQLSPKLSEAVNVRLLECERLPGLMQRQLDAVVRFHGSELDGAWRQAKAEAIADQADSGRHWKTWEVVLASVAAASAAGLAGFGLGAVLLAR